jgi:succinoglycan biosynthesis protein ExoM
LLKRLLSALEEQNTAAAFTYSVVIVDNDHAESARSAVENHKIHSSVQIDYYNEPIKNIALARNRAVKNARGNFIAFIDDDEFPIPTWLLALYSAHQEYKPDGVLGPVKPYFDVSPPAWIIKGKFCERPSHKTGTVLHWDSTRTGNVLLSKRIFDDKVNLFDPKFGLTGGEDSDFFERMIKKGRCFVWCDEAVVFETVVFERLRCRHYLKRSLRIGGLTGELARQWTSWPYYLMKVIFTLLCYSFLFPFGLILGKHISLRYLMGVLYNFGWILGFCGCVILRYREE